MSSSPTPVFRVGPYGPNSDAVERFLAGLRALSFPDLGRAVGAWRSKIDDAWHDAEDAVSRAIADTERHDERQRALEALYEVFRDAPWFSRREPGSRVPGSDASAQYVATAAMLALLVRDRLEPSQVGVLLAPFEGLIEGDEVRVA